MEAITVLSTTDQESRTLKAFLEAMRLPYKTRKPTLEELEMRLLPKQRKVWMNLKTAIQEVEDGTAEKTTWEDFLKELKDEGYITPTV
jgi:hypothetical protein